MDFDQEMLDDAEAGELLNELDGYEETTIDDAVRLREAFAKLTASLDD